jgi:hypothetical protein
VVIHQYFDHNVSRVFAESLRFRGFGITTARELGLERATDAKQFLTAVERGWVLVTHNERHYEELHDAWYRWGHHWRVYQPHPGIITLPAQPIAFIQPLLLTLLAETTDFTRKLFVWRFSTGWQTPDYRP